MNFDTALPFFHIPDGHRTLGFVGALDDRSCRRRSRPSSGAANHRGAEIRMGATAITVHWVSRCILSGQNLQVACRSALAEMRFGLSGHGISINLMTASRAWE